MPTKITSQFACWIEVRATYVVFAFLGEPLPVRRTFGFGHLDYGCTLDLHIVQDRSRFTRSGQEYASWLTFEFARHGVKIVSITSSTKPGDRYAWVIDG